MSGRYRDDQSSYKHSRSHAGSDSYKTSRDGGERTSKRARSRDRSRSPERSQAAGEDEKKKQRLAKLAAWKNKQAGSADKATDSVEARTAPQAEAERPKAWLPWEDPTAAFTAAEPTAAPPPRLTPLQPPTLPPDVGNGIDPLDAFMAAEVNPEVKAKEAEEAALREKELRERAQQRAEGKLPKLDKILEDSSDEDDRPDAVLEIPEHKIKLIVGAGGEKIKHIQRKSKCRVQIRKSEDELNKGFLEKKSYALPKPRKPGDEAKMVEVMLFGNAKECDIATRMIEEAVENREQKQKQREKEYERKRDAKSRDRQLYHLRHTHDYETLGIPIGASKADARKAYRDLAKVWHPDKHPHNVEAAKEKFQAIQKAFESLMTTDEDARIEALAHK